MLIPVDASLLRTVTAVLLLIGTPATARDAKVFDGVEPIALQSIFNGDEAPEIVGLHPGQTIKQVLATLEDKAERKAVDREEWVEGKTKQIQEPQLVSIENPDGDWFFHATSWVTGNTVYSVGRTVDFGSDRAPAPDQLEAALVAKYGEPSARLASWGNVRLDWDLPRSNRMNRKCDWRNGFPLDQRNIERLVDHRLPSIVSGNSCAGFIRAKIVTDDDDPTKVETLYTTAVDIQLYVKGIIEDDRMRAEVRRRVRQANGTEMPNL